MEVYTLDSLYRRENVVDMFESLIWTERVAAFGDFELTVISTPETRRMLKTGVRLTHNETYRTATIETFEDSVDGEGRALLTVRGRTLEMVFEDRVLKWSMTDLTVEPEWLATQTPRQLVLDMYWRICMTGALNASDILNYPIGSGIFPTDTISESLDPITMKIEPQSLYSGMKKVCDMYDMGFRLVRNVDSSQIYLDVYTGCDRTSSQSTFAPVIFSPDLDNLQNTKELTTTALYKNTAYVFSPVGTAVVYADLVDPAVAGFERRILLVMAQDVTTTVPADATAQMIAKGKEELAKHRNLSAFDGELNQNSAYKYGIDYNLGDLVEMRNVDGVTNKMRVVEQIFVSDSEGERSYPTLALNQFITAGSWLAWDYNQEWFDLDTNTTSTWGNQP